MRPWYRQFWPWFVIAPPAISVIAGVATLVIALDHADSPVREDWYRRGQLINEELALDAAAASKNISALLSVGHDGSVAVEVDVPDGSRPEKLVLELHHPTEARRDLRAELRDVGSRRFEGRVIGAQDRPGTETPVVGERIQRGSEGQPSAGEPVVAGASWDVSLQPLIADWRLEGRVSLPAEGVLLRARP